LYVSSFDVFLGYSIQHIEKLALTEWFLKVFDVRKGSMDVFPDFCSCIFVGFQSFKGPIQIRLLFLPVIELRAKIPILDTLSRRLQAVNQKCAELYLEYF
jgi:hypothetical protein